MKPLEQKERPMLFMLHSLVGTVQANHVYQHFISSAADHLALLWEYAGSACRREALTRVEG